MGRLPPLYLERGMSSDLIQSVSAVCSTRPYDFDLRIQAVAAFLSFPEAGSLTSANKRIVKILEKAQFQSGAPFRDLLVQPAETALFEAIQEQEGTVDRHIREKNYGEALRSLTALKPCVDAFFEEVLVMAPEASVRENRLRLLATIRDLFSRISDLSLLR